MRNRRIQTPTVDAGVFCSRPASPVGLLTLWLGLVRRTKPNERCTAWSHLYIRHPLLACSLRIRCNLGAKISPGPRRAQTVRAGASQTVGLLSSNMVQPRREDLSRSSQSSDRARARTTNCWLSLVDYGTTHGRTAL